MSTVNSALLVLFGGAISAIASGAIFGQILFPDIAALLGITVLTGAIFWFVLGAAIMLFALVKLKKGAGN